MTELPTPDKTKQAVARIVEKHMDAMLEDLDELHEDGIPDDEILTTLRKNGYSQEADLYHEWLQDSVPRRYVAEDGDPEGPGAVTDPPSDSYVRFEELMNESREANSITYDWTERERVMYSCRATVNREHFQKWLEKNVDSIVTTEEVDAENVVDYLEANPGASIDERRWPADESEVDIFDLKVVEP